MIAFGYLFLALGWGSLGVCAAIGYQSHHSDIDDHDHTPEVTR